MIFNLTLHAPVKRYTKIIFSIANLLSLKYRFKSHPGIRGVQTASWLWLSEIEAGGRYGCLGRRAHSDPWWSQAAILPYLMCNKDCSSIISGSGSENGVISDKVSFASLEPECIDFHWSQFETVLYKYYDSLKRWSPPRPSQSGWHLDPNYSGLGV